MFFPNPDLARRLAEELRRDRLRQAETYRLLQEVNAARPGWLSSRIRWFIRSLGRLLVALGWRLERYGASPASPPAGLREVVNRRLVGE